MPRRPRPAYRPPPKGSLNRDSSRGINNLHAQKRKRIPSPEPATHTLEDSDAESDATGEFEEGSSSEGSVSQYRVDDENVLGDNADTDTPRVAQWEEDEDDFVEELEGSVEENKVGERKALHNSLQDLPFGALRRAQQVLRRAELDSEVGTDASDDGGPSESETREEPDAKRKGKEKVEWNIHPRKDISKRSSKHAPTEVTSKRPVTRKRQVVEVPKIVPRDPRFLPITGEFSSTKFRQNYGFLAENHKKELAALRETLKHAQKQLASTPHDLRSEREQEVHRLQQAVKRTESIVNKDRMDQIEREALGQVNKVEQEKRKEGKGEWHLKKVDKRQLLMKARYEALAKEGGQRAVKKAMEKKQKKVSQKEKKSRPYGKGVDGRGSDGPARKRQRVS